MNLRMDRLFFWMAMLLSAALCLQQPASGIQRTVFQGPDALPTATPELPAVNASYTSLVMDTSDSMDEPDISGISKLEAARRAGGNILDIIAAENNADGSSASNQVGVISYNSTVSVAFGMSADINGARAALDGLQTTGRTAMADGLKAGLDQFTQGQSGSQVIILLSDGLPNIGLNGDTTSDYPTIEQQVIDLAGQAKGRSICVHTVGLGDPNAGSIDEDFLKRVASASGCGKYYNAKNANELSNIYIELRHNTTGKVLLNKSGEVRQGEEVDLGTVDVPGNQDRMLFTLSWPGSKLEPVLKDPAGQSVTNGYPGASITTNKSLISIIVKDPKSGAWKLSLKGVDVPEGVTNYKAILSTRQGKILPPTPVPTAAPPPGPGGLPLAIILILLAGGMVGIYAYSRTLKRGTARNLPAGVPGAYWLVASSGECTGQRVALRDGYTIGRSPGNMLRLSDPAVSRHHVVLRGTDGAWFIQDAGSSGGTYVNGQRVTAARLSPGDQIQIGNNLFIFQKV